VPLAPEAVRSEIREHMRYLDRRIKDLDRELRERLRASPLWREQENLLRSIPGVGPVLSTTPLADVPELGTLRHKQLAALIGLAPLTRDSGRWRGKRSIWGGRGHVRSVLNMATLTAVRRNPVLEALYRRLLTLGKPHRVAMTACMHKLLRICNAIVTHGTPWRYQPLDTSHGYFGALVGGTCPRRYSGSRPTSRSASRIAPGLTAGHARRSRRPRDLSRASGL
jgi:transposase